MRLAVLAAIVPLLAGGAPASGGDLVPLPAATPGTPWPTRAWPEAAPAPDVDRRALETALDDAFRAQGRAGAPDTRALLVARRGRLVVERYAPGFGPDSRFHSWSMAKSVTHALAGILVRQGRLALDAPVPVPAWQENGDPRGDLTLRHLLTMTSGLDNADGGAEPDSFAARLLFGDRALDVARHASHVPPVHEPGTHWAYSTGTTMLVAHGIGRLVGGGPEGLRRFMEAELGAPLGVTSLVPEFDAAGTFLGGGFVWASARDWARLGLLYLRDGVWDGRRILPEGWVDFARTRAPAANNGTYGAGFWLNGEAPRRGQWKPLPDGPASAFLMQGNDGQYVAIVPSHDLVVVRLGEQQAGTWASTGREVQAVIAAFPPLPATGGRP